MIGLSRHELLYYDLMRDLFICVLLKLHTNHNIEFALQMSGHMSEGLCYAMPIVGESIDVLMYFFLFDLTVLR